MRRENDPAAYGSNTESPAEVALRRQAELDHAAKEVQGFVARMKDAGKSNISEDLGDVIVSETDIADFERAHAELLMRDEAERMARRAQESATESVLDTSLLDDTLAKRREVNPEKLIEASLRKARLANDAKATRKYMFVLARIKSGATQEEAFDEWLTKDKEEERQITAENRANWNEIQNDSRNQSTESKPSTGLFNRLKRLFR